MEALMTQVCRHAATSTNFAFLSILETFISIFTPVEKNRSTLSQFLNNVNRLLDFSAHILLRLKYKLRASVRLGLTSCPLFGRGICENQFNCFHRKNSDAGLQLGLQSTHIF
jgi:hypothetical protein